MNEYTKYYIGVWAMPVFGIAWLYLSGDPKWFFLLAPYFFITGVISMVPALKGNTSYGTWFIYACVIPFVTALVLGVFVGLIYTLAVGDQIVRFTPILVPPA